MSVREQRQAQGRVGILTKQRIQIQTQIVKLQPQKKHHSECQSMNYLSWSHWMYKLRTLTSELWGSNRCPKVQWSPVDLLKLIFLGRFPFLWSRRWFAHAEEKTRLAAATAPCQAWGFKQGLWRKTYCVMLVLALCWEDTWIDMWFIIINWQKLGTPKGLTKCKVAF